MNQETKFFYSYISRIKSAKANRHLTV